MWYETGRCQDGSVAPLLPEGLGHQALNFAAKGIECFFASLAIGRFVKDGWTHQLTTATRTAVGAVLVSPVPGTGVTATVRTGTLEGPPLLCVAARRPGVSAT